jgi:hypothetical protein
MTPCARLIWGKGKGGKNRWKMEDGRWKREEGRGEREEGRKNIWRSDPVAVPALLNRQSKIDNRQLRYGNRQV